MTDEFKNLKNDIRRHEGYRDYVYKDSLGNLTCGWGHYLAEGSKINVVIAEEFFNMDLKQAIDDYNNLPKEITDKLDSIRKDVIINMIFNLGITKFLRFKKMLKAIEDKDWKKAHDEMLDSLWAKQVKNRAIELSQKMLEGAT